MGKPIQGKWANDHDSAQLCRPRQFHRTSIRENPSRGYRDMGSASLAAACPAGCPPGCPDRDDNTHRAQRDEGWICTRYRPQDSAIACRPCVIIVLRGTLARTPPNICDLASVLPVEYHCMKLTHEQKKITEIPLHRNTSSTLYLLTASIAVRP